MALDPNDLKALTAALLAAIRQSGGNGQERWNSTNSRVRDDTESPEIRAQAIRQSKNLEKSTKMSEELADMLQHNTKSLNDLRRFTDVNSKVLVKALNSYEDINKSTEQLTKQLKTQLEGQDNNTQIIKKLAGKLDKLEDTLAFSDLSKHMSELSKSLDSNSTATSQEIAHALENLETTIKRNGGNGVQDISADLKKFTDELAHIADNTTRAATQQDKNLGHARNVGDQIRDSAEIEKQTNALRQSNKHRVAQELLRDVSLETQTKGIQASIITTKKSTGYQAEASKRLTEWTTKVGTAAFVLDQLALAGTRLYQSLKTAGATGTEKGGWAVMGRDTRAFLNGVDPNVLQETQVKGARTRASMGKGAFDDSIIGGISHFKGITFDRGDAARLQEATLSNISRSGVGADQAKLTTASKGLYESFAKLQALTGMTGEQMSALNTEIASDTNFRQGLMNLNQQERAATVAGITEMFQENALRNISVEQTKKMIQTQLAFSDATSPKTRMKNAAKLRALGGALGIDASNASDLVLASGNTGLMKKQIMARDHITGEEADRRVKLAQNEKEQLGTKVEQGLSQNNGYGLAIEGMTNATGTKDLLLAAGQSLNEAGKMQKDAADKMMDAAVKMASINPIVDVTDFIKGSLTTIVAALVTATIAGLLYKFGGKGALTAGLNIGKNLLSKVMPNAAATEMAVIQPAAGALSNVGGRYGAAANGAARTGTIVGQAANGGLPASITRVSSGVGIEGVAGRAFGEAANGAAAPASSAIGAAAKAGWLSRIGGFAGKALGIGGGALAGIGAWNDASDINDQRKAGQISDKDANVQGGGVVGGLAGGGAGALIGAGIGQVLIPIPVVGAAIGGVIGGAIGGWGGEKAGSGAVSAGYSMFGGKPTAMGMPNSPVSPTMAQAVNTQQQVAQQAQDALKIPAKDDPQLMFNKSLTEMNTTLGQILTALNSQTESMTGDNEKLIAMQSKVQKAIKSKGFAGSAPVDGGGNTYAAA